jgi:hypothetical protein
VGLLLAAPQRFPWVVPQALPSVVPQGLPTVVTPAKARVHFVQLTAFIEFGAKSRIQAFAGMTTEVGLFSGATRGASSGTPINPSRSLYRNFARDKHFRCEIPQENSTK